jgi:hypothetical protein
MKGEEIGSMPDRIEWAIEKCTAGNRFWVEGMV